MKVSYAWLSEYVDLSGYTAESLAELLTRGGIEVDAIERRNQGVEGVVVGYVKSCEKHPNADKLNVCIVEAGQSQDLQIVCGAPNVAAGQKVPVAVVGANLPEGFKIKQVKLRGVESQGMICSAKELGMNDRLLPKEIQDGILVLPEHTVIGENILDVLALNDEVLELDLTPNRSDCLSMIGVAYEIAALIGRELKLADPESGLHYSDTEASARISVQISDAEQCGHYAARYIETVKIGPSPLWMQNRLMAAGIRPISNIVDITNYVMLEYGQPLHAFDADQLAGGGQVDVRRARPGETLVTLDDVERKLEPHTLLITDGEKPIALAGVMGGANSEVTEQTTRILLESARFAGSSVRKTARELALRSEASLRFEKEVDPSAVIPALNRAAALIAQYAGGQVARGIVEAVMDEFQPTRIKISLETINRYLGTALSSAEVQAIFARLQFELNEPDHVPDADMLIVNVPSRRGDVVGEVDLIEEVARLYGYDNIPTSPIYGETTPGAINPEQRIRRNLRSLLADSGLHEVVTYSVTHPSNSNRVSGLFTNTNPIKLSMPMSEDRSILRTGVLAQLIEVATYNRHRNNPDIAVFELGNAFVSDGTIRSKLPEEIPLLSMLWTGKRQASHWSDAGRTVDFYDLKGVFEKLLNYFGMTDISYRPIQPEGFHPGRTAQVIIRSAQEQTLLGIIGQLHPEVQKAADLEDTYVLELDLNELYRLANFTVDYKTLPRYPSSGRDMAIVIDRDVRVGDICNKVKQVAGSLLESLEVFDVYTDERLGLFKKSIAFALVYRHPERTLTDEEVSEKHAEVVEALKQNFAAELRK